MEFKSLKPFVPSGSRFEESKQLFVALGFDIAWDAGDYVSFQKDASGFILQRYDDEHFAQNLMITVQVDSADEFWKMLNDKKLVEQFGIKIMAPKIQPYGKEVNLIDLAGVCWHFVE